MSFENDFTRLLASDLFVVSGTTPKSHLDKRNVFLNMAAIETNTKREFLLRYDALMRFVEALCCAFGYEFGESPHLAMKRVVTVAIPNIDQSALRDLTDERHVVKKTGGMPSARNREFLAEVDAALITDPVLSGLLGQ